MQSPSSRIKYASVDDVIYLHFTRRAEYRFFRHASKLIIDTLQIAKCLWFSNLVHEIASFLVQVRSSYEIQMPASPSFMRWRPQPQRSTEVQVHARSHRNPTKRTRFNTNSSDARSLPRFARKVKIRNGTSGVNRFVAGRATQFSSYMIELGGRYFVKIS